MHLKYFLFLVSTYNENGDLICKGQMSTFVVNGGGFGGKSKSSVAISTAEPPSRTPNCIVKEKTSPNQVTLH